MHHHECHLIVFARPPEPGKVKTRLASTVGAQKALAVYEYLLSRVRKTIEQINAKKYIFLTHIPDMYDFWDEVADEQRCQSEGDLGHKMLEAFRFVEAKNHGNPFAAIIIGTDCPDLNEDLILDAFDALTHSDVVLGPTYDGGYYLLGMKQIYPFLFEDMPWSTKEVFHSTIERIEEHGLSCTVLKKLIDIDYETDWHQWKRMYELTHGHLPTEI